MHDTELCSYPKGCDRAAVSLDLCMTHAQAFYDPPPAYKRYAGGTHTLGESDGFGRKWCSGCRAYVRPSKNGRRCAPKQASVQRVSLTGWGPEEYDLALVRQGNRCYPCARPPGERGLVADHCHTTLAKRALLCGDCNLSLGRMKDNPELLRKAAAYIEKDWT